MHCFRTTILEDLKRSTADRHRAIEAVVPLTSPSLTVACYADYLEHLLPFYLNIEARLKALPGLASAVIDIAERWKSESLVADLHSLGRSGSSAANATCITPDIHTLPQAFGCLYVLEGSTLGGEILVRIVRKRLGEQVAGTTRFLDSYGPRIRSKWQCLCQAIESRVQQPADRDIAIRSAQATFDTLHRWLDSFYGRQSASPAAYDV
ncbi:MAG TPA: biliverdin-producing heme oxygenase [Bryobacteraceae bacterium]|jgi:heme oxygenase